MNHYVLREAARRMKKEGHDPDLVDRVFCEAGDNFTLYGEPSPKRPLKKRLRLWAAKLFFRLFLRRSR